jgi:hypothetical protein
MCKGNDEQISEKLVPLYQVKNVKKMRLNSLKPKPVYVTCTAKKTPHFTVTKINRLTAV